MAFKKIMACFVLFVFVFSMLSITALAREPNAPVLKAYDEKAKEERLEKIKLMREDKRERLEQLKADKREKLSELKAERLEKITELKTRK